MCIRDRGRGDTVYLFREWFSVPYGSYPDGNPAGSGGGKEKAGRNGSDSGEREQGKCRTAGACLRFMPDGSEILRIEKSGFLLVFTACDKINHI